MGMFDPGAKEATRAYFAREQELGERIAADPWDTGAILKLCRLQIGGDRPMKALRWINAKAIRHSKDPATHRVACDLLLEIGAYDLALRQATRGLAVEDTSELRALHARASRLLAEDEALGVTSARKLTYLTALQHLVHGQAALAGELFEQLVAEAPRFFTAWIGLRGALVARGGEAAAEALAERWIAADPASAPAIRIFMARRLSAGLLFDRRRSTPLSSMREAMQEVRSLEALDLAPTAFLPIDPGGEPVSLDAVITLQPGGTDRIIESYTTPEVFLAGVDNAALVGRGIVIDAKGQMVRELHGPNLKKYGLIDDGQAVTFDRSVPGGWVGEVRVYDTPAMLMAGASDQSFGDWLLIYAPRLAIARAAGLRCPVVVSARAPEPFIELLRQLGVRDDEIIRHDPHGVSLFRKLYVPSWPLRDYLRPMSGLFEIYRELALPSTPGPGRRVYLSRERIAQRPLVNEAEVRELFERRGFEVVHPQELSLRQMRELMADAEFVAAPYGSALLNLAMAGGRPTVMVCVGSDKDGFRRQAALWVAAMGLKLAYVRGRTIGERGASADKEAAWTVSIPAVEQMLAAVLPS